MISLLDALLAPLARLMVARGILFPDLAERLKAHYVAAAQDQTDGKITDSRLSVMTGLQRRDIARLREAPPREARPNHLSKLVAAWQTRPDYQQTRDLARSGPAPSFEALANDLRRDVHPRTMLDALEAAGTVETDGDRIRLLKSSYQPLAGSEDQLAYLSHNLGDHIDAATENVLGADPAHFERAVHYTELHSEDVEALRSAHETGQMALFEMLSAQAAEMKSRSPSGGRRFRAGAYFYAKDEDQT